MNFYASYEYLELVASIYYDGRPFGIEDVRVGDDVLRLLVLDRTRVITRAQFLDYHEPLRGSEIGTVSRTHRRADAVVHGIVDLSASDRVFEGDGLAPYVDWAGFASWEAYQAHLLKSNRGLVRERERRARRLVGNVGALTFRMDDEADDVLEAAARWKSRQIREQGMHDYFADPRTIVLLGRLRAKRLLTASTLRASGRLMAAWIGFVHDGVWSGWIFTHDPALRKYSVGHQLLHAMLEESFRQGHREFDFSIGAEPYKMIYATHGRVLGTSGRVPLAERLAAHAKQGLRDRTPRLFAAARDLKREFNRRRGPQGFLAARL